MYAKPGNRFEVLTVKEGTTVQTKRLTALVLALVLLSPLFAHAEESGMDAFYDLAALAVAREGETIHLQIPQSYYSGETIYKGKTGKPLTGACALHCAAVVISNLKGQTVTGQQVAKANNRDIRRDTSWTPFVSWGKVGDAFSVRIRTEDMAQYGARLKQRGVKTSERRVRKMARLVELLGQSAPDSGLVVHFNSSGRLNGSGTHRHAVVLIGWIERDGAIVDLLVNDSSIPAPLGVCVRMSESSLPVSILGKRKAGQADARGDNLAMILMDYAVSCRWVRTEEN